MASNNVAQFATELKMSADVLLTQLQTAGVSKVSATDILSKEDKDKLLEHLRLSHGVAPDAEKMKITIVRKESSEIKQADAHGKSRTIQVQVKKTRTFVKRDESAPEAAAQVSKPSPVVDVAELARREVEAAAEAELVARQEAELKEKQDYLAKLEAEKEAEAKAVQELAAAAAAAKAKAKAEADKLKQAEASRNKMAKAAVAAVNAPVVEVVVTPTPAELEAKRVAADEAKKAAAVLAKEAAKEAAVRVASSDAARKKVADEVAQIKEMMLAARRPKVVEPVEAVEPAATVAKVASKVAEGTLHKPT
ncbi:MAG: translation initiation factor IF-2 associated domain-containing protein, partial [Undibacterium sp.]|nr:translation initiation factor IF-2 associated domain-containing protein [Undibacterium sp.]